ncbi:helix-turn-helix transcriptional regulator [Photobacterium sp. BZF1]|uniref:helix-turn-helix domain-containing protein n=1 Tax=Photobacterium sp. BZF1 TaxID=1904457 RepID=UPI0016535C8A|nr:helix-turn-helix transcriptional regulator [Photobacterium sp. BZF1]
MCIDTPIQSQQSLSRQSSTQTADSTAIRLTLDNGILIHGGSTSHDKSANVTYSASESVVFTLLIKGELHFGYDHIDCHLDATDSVKGVAVNITKPCCFQRQINKGEQVRKIHIVVKPEWFRCRLEDQSPVNQFIDTHLANWEINVTAEINHLVTLLLQPMEQQTLANHLVREQYINLLMQALVQQLYQYTPPAISLPVTHTSNELAQIIEFIERNLKQPVALSEIAQHVCMSISSLQRHFKVEMGETVQQYIRKRRLEIAKIQIEKGLMSISEAAYSYGYKHPSNFSLAFKKEFGISPIELVNIQAETHERNSNRRPYLMACPQ